MVGNTGRNIPNTPNPKIQKARTSKRGTTGTNKLLLDDSEVAVTTQGKYMKMPLNKIAGNFNREEERKVLQPENDDNILLKLYNV